MEYVNRSTVEHQACTSALSTFVQGWRKLLTQLLHGTRHWRWKRLAEIGPAWRPLITLSLIMSSYLHMKSFSLKVEGDGEKAASSKHNSRDDALYQHVHFAAIGSILDHMQVWLYVHYAPFNSVNETWTIQELHYHGSYCTTVERNQLPGIRFRAINCLLYHSIRNEADWERF